jgi:hypothetical protein
MLSSFDFQENFWIFIAISSLGTIVLAVTALATYRLQRRVAARSKTSKVADKANKWSNSSSVHVGKNLKIGDSASFNVSNNVPRRDQ